MNDFVLYVLDVINPVFPVTARSMFGGYGIYRSGTMFAIIVKNTLYLKTDDSILHYFENENCLPFTYETKNGSRTMSYYTMPERLFDNTEECRIWLSRSYEVAVRSKQVPKNTGKKITTSSDHSIMKVHEKKKVKEKIKKSSG